MGGRLQAPARRAEEGWQLLRCSKMPRLLTAVGVERPRGPWVECVVEWPGGGTAGGETALLVLGVPLAVFFVGKDHLGIAYFADDQDARAVDGLVV